MKLVWSLRAVSDLQSHCDFIAGDSPQAAAAVEERVLGTVERLRDHPLVGRLQSGRSTRDLIVARTGLMVIYQVRGGDVVIVRVRHQMQRPFGG